MQRLAAAVTLFTRVPVWRWLRIPEGAYPGAVAFWPLTGWLTGGVAALVVAGLHALIAPAAAVALALAARLLLTGALHEDGLADFCDGFGGGRDKERILAIMKDSHIGTYGVIGLICYFVTTVTLLGSLPPYFAALAILAADPLAKTCASQLTNLLPYARPEGAKNKVTYSRMGFLSLAVNILAGLIPAMLLAAVSPMLLLALPFPAAAALLMGLYMKRRIGGYTGDCCGATFLVCELTMLIAVAAIFTLLL